MLILLVENLIASHIVIYYALKFLDSNFSRKLIRFTNNVVCYHVPYGFTSAKSSDFAYEKIVD